MSLNFHCCCEQYVHYASGGYFNFQGTAGVWRVAAMDAVGGWKSRTTVEDMDLSLRTYLAGWKAVFLPHVTVVNEARLTCNNVPSPFFFLPGSVHPSRTPSHTAACKLLCLSQAAAPLDHRPRAAVETHGPGRACLSPAGHSQGRAAAVLFWPAQVCHALGIPWLFLHHCSTFSLHS